ARFVAVEDGQALEGFQALCRAEGIIPALEPAHAVYHAIQLASQRPTGEIVLVNLSGRGDKDMETVAGALGVTL
ncbi:MAG TPA: tryptophan synthase subunit beta, partial [Dehalococcoidia bacterium]|nr:tryptophan synthase subunit beta [Dehalococcoidia bacterium]